MATQASKAMIVQEPQSEPRALTPAHSEQAILTRDGLKVAAEQRKLLAEYVKEQMVPNTDFGIIPGTDKPTLLKPGAEKLVELFRCTPQFEVTERIEDFDRPLFAYTFRVRILQRDAQVILAEGYGSCNSREGRYRWRNASRKCPSCGKEAIIKGKAEFGGGWLCFDKKGGCKAKYPDGAPEIEKQEVGKVENPDVADLANTILKMAKKRALVDGAIALARVSDLFTQDADDAPARDQGHSAPAKKPSGPKLPIWQQAVVIAADYGFACGEGNKLLWALAATTTAGKKPAEWTDADLKIIEKALAEATGQPPPPYSDVAEPDINF